MLIHKGTRTIETERLILRRVRVEDAQSMFENYACDDEVTKYLSWPTHTSPEISAMVLKDWVSSYEKDDFYLWGITVKDEGDTLIGTISAFDVNDSVGMAEIGYCIGRHWWHRGIMTETLQAVMDYLFDEVGMNRLQACHDPRNPNSGRVMVKCGMSYEGTLRQHGRNNQGICDTCYYARLRSER